MQPRVFDHALGLRAARPDLPTPLPGPAGQVAPAGCGAADWAGRLFLALAQCPGPARQAAQGRRRSQREGLCRRPALGPAARRQGLGEGDAAGAAAGANPPHSPSRAAADTASGGLQRELAPPGTGGGRRPSARAARPVRTRGGTGEGRGLRVGKTRETDPCTSPTQGFLCLLHTRLCLQLSNLGTEEAGTPACW